MKLLKYFGIVFMFLLTLMSVNAAETTLYNHSTDYVNITNDADYVVDMNHGGWSTIDATGLIQAGNPTSYNKRAKVDISNLNVSEGEYLNITFTHKGTTDRYGGIGLSNGNDLNVFGFAYASCFVDCAGADHEYVGLATGYTNWATAGFVGLAKTHSRVLGYTTITSSDSTDVPYEWLYNGTHSKLTRNGVVQVNWVELPSGYKNMDLVGVEFITQAYQSGTNDIKDFTIVKVSPDLTPQITLNITNGQIFNYTPINVSMDTTSIVNMSVYINQVLNQTFLNTNSTTALLDLSEGINNLSFKSEDTDGVVWNNISITNDYTAPNISIIGNITQDFVVNFSTIFNVTDALSGLASCTINITYLENVTNASQYDKFVNCTDTTTFGAAGLYNGFIEAYDNAGNLATLSINGTIEVYVYLNFFDENATAITNYSATIYHPDGEIETITNTSNPIELSPYHNDTLDIGTYVVTFDKFGYDLYNVSVEINETSGGIEYNYSIPGAVIQIAVYDVNDFTLISGSNTTIEIIGDSYSSIYTTSTGLLNITSLEMREETYNVIVSNADYETTTISFNFNNQEVIEINAYMTPLTLNDTLIADLIIRLVDDYQTPLRGLNVIQYVWDSGAGEYVQANLKATDYNGETSFKVFLNTKLYNFCGEYLGVQYCENDLSININTQEVVIEIPISELDVYDTESIYNVDFSYSLSNSTYESGGINYTSVTFSYSNPNQDVDTYCLKIYQIENLQRSLVANQCSTSHTAGLSVNIVENTTNNYVAVATIQVGDAIRELEPALYLYATSQIQDELDEYGFVKIILLAVVGFLIGVAIHRKVHNIAIAHFGLPIAYLIFSLTPFFPDYISFESFVLVLLVNLFAWKIATQKDDLKRDAGFSTLNSILALYMIFIFGLHTALTEIDNKGLLDDYGQVILDNIDDDNSYFDNYLNTKGEELKLKRSDANTGAWELLTGIFLKTLEFVDLFFSILSNLFSIATNIGLIIGIKNALLLKFIKIIDYSIVAFVVYLYFKEAFK